MQITKCTRKVSDRDFRAIKRMHGRKMTLSQTKTRRIKIWRALGAPDELDVHIVTTRKLRNGYITELSNLVRIALEPASQGAAT